MLRDESNNACQADYRMYWICVGMQAGAEEIEINQLFYGELMGLLNFLVLALVSLRAFRKLMPKPFGESCWLGKAPLCKVGLNFFLLQEVPTLQFSSNFNFPNLSSLQHFIFFSI